MQRSFGNLRRRRQRSRRGGAHPGRASRRSRSPGACASPRILINVQRSAVAPWNATTRSYAERPPRQARNGGVQHVLLSGSSEWNPCRARSCCRSACRWRRQLAGGRPMDPGDDRGAFARSLRLMSHRFARRIFNVTDLMPRTRPVATGRRARAAAPVRPRVPRKNRLDGSRIRGRGQIRYAPRLFSLRGRSARAEAEGDPGTRPWSARRRVRPLPVIKDVGMR